MTKIINILIFYHKIKGKKKPDRKTIPLNNILGLVQKALNLDLESFLINIDYL